MKDGPLGETIGDAIEGLLLTKAGDCDGSVVRDRAALICDAKCLVMAVFAWKVGRRDLVMPALPKYGTLEGDLWILNFPPMSSPPLKHVDFEWNATLAYLKGLAAEGAGDDEEARRLARALHDQHTSIYDTVMRRYGANENRFKEKDHKKGGLFYRQAQWVAEEVQRLVKKKNDLGLAHTVLVFGVPAENAFKDFLTESCPEQGTATVLYAKHPHSVLDGGFARRGTEDKLERFREVAVAMVHSLGRRVQPQWGKEQVEERERAVRELWGVRIQDETAKTDYLMRASGYEPTADGKWRMTPEKKAQIYVLKEDGISWGWSDSMKEKMVDRGHLVKIEGTKKLGLSDSMKKKLFQGGTGKTPPGLDTEVFKVDGGRFACPHPGCSVFRSTWQDLRRHLHDRHGQEGDELFAAAALAAARGK